MDFNLLEVKEEYSLKYNTEARYIYLDTEIEMDTATCLLDRIARIVHGSKSEDPITLIISSPGGDVYGLLGILDVINESKVKINTHVLGAAMSAAAFIAMSGTGVRTMGSSSYFMIHQIQAMIGGSMDAVASESKQAKKLQDACYNILTTKSNKPIKWWTSSIKQNLFIDKKTALELGIIDA